MPKTTIIIGNEIARANHLFSDLLKKVESEYININAQIKFTPMNWIFVKKANLFIKKKTGLEVNIFSSFAFGILLK